MLLKYRMPLIVVGLIVATLLVYSNSFGVPFLFDDPTSIVTNSSIHQLWPPWQIFRPPVALTVGGRPLLNLTLAVNYALGGVNVFGYHLVNLLIHILAGLILFGVVRRALLRTPMEPNALPLSAAIALLWLLHPLQTESVTYIIQRAESLVSLWYLLTLYCAIRFIEAGQRQWSLAAVVACAAGMLSKEVMVSAPLLVLLFDRSFVAGSFREAWRLRKGLYLGLGATLLILAALLATNGRGNTAGFDSPLPVLWYALTQVRAVVLYLSLMIWPQPLIFDYGKLIDNRLIDVAWQAVMLALLLTGTAWALWRSPRVGVAAVAFFFILAPSSSVVPIATQTMAEHRVYLALAPVLVLLVLGVYRMVGRWTVACCLVWAAALGVRTYLRNRDYQSSLTLWAATAEKMPRNPRALQNLAGVLDSLGRHDEALAKRRQAVRIAPEAVEDGYSRALVILDLLDAARDSAAYRGVAEIYPDSVTLHITLGQILLQLNRPREAADQFEMVLRKEPGNLAVRRALEQIRY